MTAPDMTAVPPVGARVLAIATRWIGTPYRHQGAREGVGCDCLGLVRGIWRELYGEEPEPVPAYGRDWAQGRGDERLAKAAARHFLSVDPGDGPHAADLRPGDLLLFRFHPRHAARHAGIFAGADEDGVFFIHAYEQAGVIRSALVPAWRRRLAAIFRFPEV